MSTHQFPLFVETSSYIFMYLERNKAVRISKYIVETEYTETDIEYVFKQFIAPKYTTKQAFEARLDDISRQFDDLYDLCHETFANAIEQDEETIRLARLEAKQQDAIDNHENH